MDSNKPLEERLSSEKMNEDTEIDTYSSELSYLAIQGNVLLNMWSFFAGVYGVVFTAQNGSIPTYDTFIWPFAIQAVRGAVRGYYAGNEIAVAKKFEFGYFPSKLSAAIITAVLSGTMRGTISAVYSLAGVLAERCLLGAYALADTISR